LSSERKKHLTNVELSSEKEFVESASNFLEERFGARVAVYSEEDNSRYDPKQRAALAIPGQPAIYIE
jgi:hypothetical protein